LLNPRTTHPPAGFFVFLGPFSLAHSSAFLSKGKREREKRAQKHHGEALPKKIAKAKDLDEKSRCQFFLDFLIVLSRPGCFSPMGVQRHYKKWFTSKSCRKVFFKTKIQTQSFSVIYHVFRRFSVRGVKKKHGLQFCPEDYYRQEVVEEAKELALALVREGIWRPFGKTNIKRKPGSFSISDPPTHNVGHRFFCRPLASCCMIRALRICKLMGLVAGYRETRDLDNRRSDLNPAIL
jgi:hypothetical protein